MGHPLDVHPPSSSSVEASSTGAGWPTISLGKGAAALIVGADGEVTTIRTGNNDASNLVRAVSELLEEVKSFL